MSHTRILYLLLGAVGAWLAYRMGFKNETWQQAVAALPVVGPTLGGYIAEKEVPQLTTSEVRIVTTGGA